ncbi:MAG: hypothetical protein ABF839_06815 [Acetobacter orientalis]|uniref:hypothetical protein n=1 Tax=Acetobacter orientalis TaxID=146474 RepID=UPI0039E83D87
MQDPNVSQPSTWAAFFGAAGGVLFTIRWLIGFGGKSAQATIKSQSAELTRLNKRMDEMQAQITLLQHENDTLRGVLGLRPLGAV